MARPALLLLALAGAALARPGPPASQQEFEQLVPSSKPTITEEELYVMIEHMLMEAYGDEYEPPTPEYIQRYLNKPVLQPARSPPRKPIATKITSDQKVAQNQAQQLPDRLFQNIMQNSIVRETNPMLRQPTISELIRQQEASLPATKESLSKQISGAQLTPSKPASTNIRPGSPLIINPALLAKLVKMQKKNAQANSQTSEPNKSISFPVEKVLTRQTPLQSSSNMGKSSNVDESTAAKYSHSTPSPPLEEKPNAKIGSVKIISLDSMKSKEKPQKEKEVSNTDKMADKPELPPPKRKTGAPTSEELKNAVVLEQENQPKIIIVDRRTKSKNKPIA